MTDPTPMDPNAPMESAASEPAPAAAPAPATPAPPAPPAPTATSAAAAAIAARPTGITILAVLAGLGGVVALFTGFLALFVGTLVGLGPLLGIAGLAYAGLILSFAFGAWTLKPWAWTLGVAGAAFGIVIGVLGIFGSSGLGGSIIGIAIDGGILYYLNQPGIRSLFGRA